MKSLPERNLVETSKTVISWCSRWFFKFNLLVLLTIYISPYLQVSSLSMLHWWAGNQLIRIIFILPLIFTIIHFLALRNFRWSLLSLLLLVLPTAEIINGIPRNKDAGEAEQEPVIRVTTFNYGGVLQIQAPIYKMYLDEVDIVALQEIPLDSVERVISYSGRYGYSGAWCVAREGNPTALVILSSIEFDTSYSFPVGSVKSGQVNVLNLELVDNKRRILVQTVHAEPQRNAKEAIPPRRLWLRRMQQLKQLGESSDRFDGMVILAGDFNTTPTSMEVRNLSGRLKDSWKDAGFGFGGTWYLDLPLFRIDYIFQRGFSAATNGYVYRASASDHRAYQVDLHL